MPDLTNNLASTRKDYNGQKNYSDLRKQVQHLYFDKKLSKKQIARDYGLSPNFVRKWCKEQRPDPVPENRGWQKGKGRTYPMEQIDQQVKQLYEKLKQDPKEFFLSATSLQHNWTQHFPGQKQPSISTLGRSMKRQGLSQSPRTRQKGASRYLLYPEHTIYKALGGRMLEADFMSRFITGGQILHFIGFSFKDQSRLRHYRRIEAQTGECFLESFNLFCNEFETPDRVKVDNCAALIGSSSAVGTISEVGIELLSREIVPVFAVPRKPFTQASIEGNNSVFSRNFWNSRQFTSADEVDRSLEDFNKASLRFTQYTPVKKQQDQQKAFVPQLLFIRQLHLDPVKNCGFIDVLHKRIDLEAKLVPFFVLCQWNLPEQRLNIWLEEQPDQLREIASMKFPIHLKTIKRIKKGGYSFI